jgi:hypothetical protein
MVPRTTRLVRPWIGVAPIRSTATTPPAVLGSARAGPAEISNVLGCSPGPGLLCTANPTGSSIAWAPDTTAASTPVAPIPGRGR